MKDGARPIEASEDIGANVPINASATFVEDDVVMEMGLEELQREFPSSEDEQDPESLLQPSLNNNATVGDTERIQSSHSAQGSRTSREATRLALPNFDPGHSFNSQEAAINAGQQGMNATIGLMQTYMLQKGLIDSSMPIEQFNEFLQKQNQTKDQNENTVSAGAKRKSSSGNKSKTSPPGRDSISSDSEITIYKQAVRTLDPNLGLKIDELFNKSRGEAVEANKILSLLMTTWTLVMS